MEVPTRLRLLSPILTAGTASQDSGSKSVLTTAMRNVFRQFFYPNKQHGTIVISINKEKNQYKSFIGESKNKKIVNRSVFTI